jgi:hypothetical protein
MNDNAAFMYEVTGLRDVNLAPRNLLLALCSAVCIDRLGRNTPLSMLRIELLRMLSEMLLVDPAKFLAENALH